MIGVTLGSSSDMIGTDKTNFSQNLALINRQVASLCRIFASNSPKDIKLSKTRISNIIIRWGVYLGILI